MDGSSRFEDLKEYARLAAVIVLAAAALALGLWYVEPLFHATATHEEAVAADLPWFVDRQVLVLGNDENKHQHQHQQQRQHPASDRDDAAMTLGSYWQRSAAPNSIRLPHYGRVAILIRGQTYRWFEDGLGSSSCHKSKHSGQCMDEIACNRNGTLKQDFAARSLIK